jgi:hypothetical protein
MSEALFSLEESLILALLLSEGPKSDVELAHAFDVYDGPDTMPADLTDNVRVGAILEDLWGRDVLLPLRTADRYDLEPKLRELMRLGGTVAVGGLLGVRRG